MPTPAELEAEIARLLLVEQDLNQQLADKNVEIATLNGELSTCEANLTSVRNQLTVAEANHESLLINHTLVTDDLADANEKLAGFPSEVEELKSVFDEMLVRLDVELRERRAAIGGNPTPGYIEEVSFKKNEIRRLTTELSAVINGRLEDFNKE